MVLSVVPGWANLKKDAQGCGPENTNDPDKMIRACSALIKSGRLSNEDLAIAHYNRGNGHEKKDEYDQAIQDYDEAIRLNPSYGDALGNRGYTYYVKGDRDHAMQDFEQAIRLNPNDSTMIYYRGLGYYDKGEYDRSIQDFDQAIKLDPSRSDAFQSRGRAYNDKGDYDRAIQDYDQAVKLNPNSSEAFYYRGIACENKGDHDLALRDYDQAIRLSPNYADAFRGRGEAYIQKGDYDHAIQDLDQAIKSDANDATALKDRGDAYNDKGDYDHAIQDYDQAIKLNPNYDQAFRDRALAYDGKGDHDRAIQDFNEAIRLNPKSADGFYGRGNVYDSKGDHDRAIQDFNEAIRLYPNFAGAFNNRGLAYTGKGDFDRALQDYDEAIRLDPELAEAHYGRGNAYNHKGDYDRAIKELDAALQLDPNLSFAYASRGAAYDEKGELDQASANYDQAIRLNPSDENTLRNRGVLYAKKSQSKLAILDFNEALRLNPNDGDALGDRGYAHFFLGEFADAQQDLARMRAYPYPAIWLYLARARAGQPAQSDLAKDAAKLDLKAWPSPVVNLFLDKATPEAFLAAAKDKDPKKDREQHCEAYFYLGQRALIAGKQDEANKLFQKSLDTHVTTFYEYMGAQAELQRASADAIKQCGDQQYTNPDAALRFCSAAIGSGQLQGARLARLYNHRGNAYQKKGQYDLAILDYSQAIRLKPAETKPKPAEAKPKPKPADSKQNPGAAKKFDVDIGDDLADAFGAVLGLDDESGGLELDDVFGSANPFAAAFADRGAAYASKGDNDHALQDYDQAIQLDPHFGAALSARADAYVRRGEYERAVQDYDKAIQANSALAEFRGWYEDRGVAHFFLAQFAAAQQDFAASVAKLPKYPYGVVWLYLARARAGQAATDELATNAAKLDLKEFPGPAINFYLGKATADSVLAAANDPDPKKDRDLHCSAYFYLGEKALIDGKPDDARRFLQQALETRFTNSDMYRGAGAELQRLSAAPAQPRR